MVCLSMTSSETGSLLSTVQWSDEGTYVRELATKGRLPLLAKVIKGQYFTVGVSTLTNPGMASNLLLLSGGKCLRVLAQCVKFKENRRLLPVGPKLAIPEFYDGYFEILSEDGKAVKCIESVAELQKRFPDSCLVRESIKAYISKSDDIETITDKTRLVQVGETLVLVGEVSGPTNGKSCEKYLRCFDQSGQNIYLSLGAKGKFSAIAKEDNISGVHSIKNLLNKRLPLMVRLIHGRAPTGPKIASQFLPELRLFTAFSEDVMVAVPIGKDSPPLLLPSLVPLKMTSPKNFDDIAKTKEFMRICDRSSHILQDLKDRIQVYDVSLGNKSFNTVKDPRFFGSQHIKNQSKHSQSHTHKVHHLKKPPDKNLDNRKNGKTDDYDEIDQIYDYVRGIAPLPKHIRHPYGQKDIFGRRMSAPAKFANDTRPPPPPIETIPSRKGLSRENLNEKLCPSVHPALISAVLEKAERKPENKQEPEKVSKKSPVLDGSSSIVQSQSPQTSKMNSKLFVKASHQRTSKNRLLRNKSNSPIKDAIFDLVKETSVVDTNRKNKLPHPQSTSQSPLFKMRYKSLTNLAMNFDTIESSTSVGRRSNDSSGGSIRPSIHTDKRSRKLPRPKSLTNLAWDLKPGTSLENVNLSHGNSAGKALLDAERKMRLEPGVYRHARDAPALLAATTRILASQRKIGTLYM